HLHAEYAQIREMSRVGIQSRLWMAVAYVPGVLLLPYLYSALRLRTGFDFVAPGNSLGKLFQIWLVASLLISAWWQWRFSKAAPDKQQKLFHRSVLNSLMVLAVWISVTHLWGLTDNDTPMVTTSLAVAFVLLPLVSLIRNVQRFNFLQIGRQRNLIYAVSATFLALLYLSLVRRVSGWLEPVLPPEASASILLFVLVIFIEPLQRLLGRTLQETAQREMDRVQRLTAEIQQEARRGNLKELVSFIQRRAREQFELA